MTDLGLSVFFRNRYMSFLPVKPGGLSFGGRMEAWPVSLLCGGLFLEDFFYALVDF